MSGTETNIEEVILRLEGLKRDLEHCQERSLLLATIDTTMETLIQYQASEGTSLAAGKGELITRLRYLRELRASALDLDEEQVEDFSRDFLLILSSMQFQLWRGNSKELFSLIDASNS